MKLEGSCHCGSVRFSVEAPHPVPYLRCYCSICRKTAGGGGYAINLGALNETLEVTGKEFLSVYQAMISDPQTGEKQESPARRHFCKKCGSALWNWDPRWPDQLHPFASAIDGPLPRAPTHTHMMLGSKADWVPVDSAAADEKFDEYPDKSLADWHDRNWDKKPTS